MYKNNKHKKIGILTFHFPYNFGAMLQAYALQKVILNATNANCEVIAYEPPEHVNIFVPRIRNCFKINIRGGLIGTVKEVLYGIYLYFKEKNHIRKYNFASFQRKYLKKSKVYRTKNELGKNLSYDCIIVGSDQIWRKDVRSGYDNTYFLDFPDAELKRFTYAASAGGCFPTEDLPILRKYFDTFNVISVREKNLSTQLDEFGIANRVDLDPTLLLNKQDYILLEKQIHLPSKFIFVYLCRDNNIIRVLDCLSKKLCLDIVVGPYVDFKDKTPFKYINLDYIGPREFLYCVHNAEFIVTSSFHCTVFSIIYDRPFLAMPQIGNFDRIFNLLETYNLQEHIFSSLNNITYEHDYEEAHNSIRNDKEASLEYIKSIVNS